MTDYVPDRERMLAEIEQLLGSSGREEYPRPNVTTGEWADRQGVDRATARKQLLRLRRAGKLEGKKILIDGRMSWLFWQPKDAGTCAET